MTCHTVSLTLRPAALAHNLDAFQSETGLAGSPTAINVKALSGMRGRGRVDMTGSSLNIYMLDNSPFTNEADSSPPGFAPYKIDVSTGGRNRCKGPKDNCGKLIAAGQLRLGISRSRSDGQVITDWRHWDCLTPAVMEHLKDRHSNPDGIPGISSLSKKHRARVTASYRGKNRQPRPKAASASRLSGVPRRSLRLLEKLHPV